MPDDDGYECGESASAAPSGALVCNLPMGHDGLHWDGQDDITWKAGPPDA
jgi:hypothetical protein